MKKYVISTLPYLVTFILSIIVSYYFYNQSANVSLEAQQLSRNLYQLSKPFNKTFRERHKFESFNTLPNEFGITLNGKQYQDVIISYWLLKNPGPKPISENDYAKPITVIPNGGSKILLIQTVEAKNKGLFCNWELKEDGKFAQLPKILINRDEWIKVCITYQFNPDDEKSQYLKWNTRIAGLDNIDITYINPGYVSLIWFGPEIYYVGYQIYTLVFFILLIVLSNVIIAQKMNKFPVLNIRKIIIFLFISFFGLTTGDIVMYVLFRKNIYWNAAIPLIIAHALFILYLFNFHRLFVKKAHSSNINL